MLVDELDLVPPLTGLCAGYELGEWRSEQFSRYLLKWLPEFALSWPERQGFRDTTAIELIERAAHAVYATEKYGRRGEFGELLLHAIVRQLFDSEPVISKIYYKDAANDTVKGFDCVHVVRAPAGHLELWLGEAKFYDDIGSALSHVAAELRDHIERDYLRSEFALIRNKVDPNWPSAEEVGRLLHPNTSLDSVFEVLRIPVLLTYDSRTVQSFSEYCDEYFSAFTTEVHNIWERFERRDLPPKTFIHLLLVPLSSKAELVEHLHKGLKKWQSN